MKRCFNFYFIFVAIPVFIVVNTVKAGFIEAEREILSDKFIIIDIRDFESYKKGHPIHSISIPYSFFEEIMKNEDYEKLHNLFESFGITPEKKVFILPNKEDDLLKAGALGYLSMLAGVPNVFVIKDGYRGWLDKKLSFTTKGRLLTPTKFERAKKDPFVNTNDLKKMQKKHFVIINIAESKKKSKEIINLPISAILGKEFIKSCENIKRLIFTGKSKIKKDIILQNGSHEELFFAAFFIERHCNLGNVKILKEVHK